MNLPPHQSTKDLNSSGVKSNLSEEDRKDIKSNNWCGGLVALDFGTRKVGVAISHGFVADAYATLPYDEKLPESFISSLEEIVIKQNADILVVGVPMGREGKPTRQGNWTRKNAKKAAKKLGLQVKFTEESFSSVVAKEVLGKKYTKEKIDAESAKIILDQYLNEHPNSSL